MKLQTLLSCFLICYLSFFWCWGNSAKCFIRKFSVVFTRQRKLVAALCILSGLAPCVNKLQPCRCFLQRLFYVKIIKEYKKMNGTRTLQPDGRFGVSSFDPLVDPGSNPHTLIGTCSERFFINTFSSNSKFKYCFNFKVFCIYLRRA